MSQYVNTVETLFSYAKNRGLGLEYRLAAFDELIDRRHQLATQAKAELAAVEADLVQEVEQAGGTVPARGQLFIAHHGKLRRTLPG